MIKHIVLYRLKDCCEENLQKTKEILLSMDGKIPYFKEISVGIDYLHSERSYDIALEMLFEDETAFTAYKTHPYHVEVVQKHMHSARETSVSVDYIV